MISKKDTVLAIANILKENGPAKSPTTLAALIVDDIFAGWANALAEGKEVILPGLGKLKPKARPATAERQGRNPRTGESMTISAKPEERTIKIKVGKDLKALLAGGAV